MTEEKKNLGILVDHRITINYQSNAVAKSPMLTGEVYLVRIRKK